MLIAFLESSIKPACCGKEGSVGSSFPMPFCSGEVLIQFTHLIKLHLLDIWEVSCSLVHQQQRCVLDHSGCYAEGKSATAELMSKVNKLIVRNEPNRTVQQLPAVKIVVWENAYSKGLTRRLVNVLVTLFVILYHGRGPVEECQSLPSVSKKVEEWICEMYCIFLNWDKPVPPWETLLWFSTRVIWAPV